jgi:hypothetical protein
VTSPEASERKRLRWKFAGRKRGRSERFSKARVGDARLIVRKLVGRNFARLRRERA